MDLEDFIKPWEAERLAQLNRAIRELAAERRGIRQRAWARLKYRRKADGKETG